MKRFNYHRPATLSEVVSLLTETPGAHVLAGGTDLVIAMRDHEVEPDAVIDIKRVVEFRPPLAWADDTVVFSASAVMADVAGDEGVQARFPGLVEAALAVGSVQIRNRATLVGNICNGSPAADTAPPLLVYGATVVVAGPEGERRVPIDEFIVGPGQVALERGELATAIEVPVPQGPLGSAYERMTRRKGTDLASVTLCCSVDGTGTTRLAYGSVGPRALLVVDDSGVLADSNSPPAARDEVLERFFAEASPSPTSLRASPDYRRAMLRVLGRRAVDRAVARLADPGGAG